MLADASPCLQNIPGQIHSMIHKLNSEAANVAMGASEFAAQLVKLAPYCTVAAALARRGREKQVRPVQDPVQELYSTCTV